MKEQIKKTSNGKIAIWVVLHVMLALYSLSGVFTKMAANEPFLSKKFCLCYGATLFILAVYALGWQQIIKRMPLTAAFANKAVSLLWGCIYGIIFFKEHLSLGKIIGGLIVATGVILFAISNDSQTDIIKEENENA